MHYWPPGTKAPSGGLSFTFKVVGAAVSCSSIMVCTSMAELSLTTGGRAWKSWRGVVPRGRSDAGEVGGDDGPYSRYGTHRLDGVNVGEGRFNETGPGKKLGPSMEVSLVSARGPPPSLMDTCAILALGVACANCLCFCKDCFFKFKFFLGLLFVTSVQVSSLTTLRAPFPLPPLGFAMLGSAAKAGDVALVPSAGFCTAQLRLRWP